jgi:hypothetical protein
VIAKKKRKIASSNKSTRMVKVPPEVAISLPAIYVLSKQSPCQGLAYNEKAP